MIQLRSALHARSLSPQSQANEWGRDVFGLALAVQNIVWGLAQPFTGMLADRFGIVRVLCAGRSRMPRGWS